MFKKTAQWQRRQSGSGGVRKRDTGCSKGGSGGNSAAAEVATAAAARQQKAAWLAERQDSGGNRAKAAMAARQWRWQSKIGGSSTAAAKGRQDGSGSAATSGQY
jgi:hypothetical protein